MSNPISREADYRLALSILSTLRSRSLLTASDYRRAKQRLIQRFQPLWGHLPDITAPRALHKHG